MVGARAIVRVGGEIVGLFDSCQYGASVGAEPIHTLGRYSPNEISITSYEAIQVSCSGFRVIGQNVHKLPRAPKLQDLLNFEAVQLTVEDRQSGKTIAQVDNCVPVNWGEAQQAKGTTRFNITYLGTVLSQESDNNAGADDQVESAGSTELV
jgi:hypothetical protein